LVDQSLIFEVHWGVLEKLRGLESLFRVYLDRVKMEGGVGAKEFIVR